jgi:cobalt-zinc-cadmium efflux system outer membrane protein
VSVAAESLRLQNQQRATAGRLNVLLARPAEAALAKPEGARALPAGEPRMEALLARTRDANAQLFAQSAEIKSADFGRQLAAKAWRPDVSVGAGAARFDNGDFGYTLMLGVKLPLQSEAKEAGEREASAKVGAARERFAATAAQIEGDLQEQLTMLATAKGTIALVRDEQVPQLEGALQSVLSDYGRGRADFRSVLETEHRLHDVRLTIIRSETDAQTALAAIERLIGGTL